MVAGELKSLYEVALSAIGLPTTPALYPIPAPDTSASANSPYIIGFHGAFIDINFGAVCLALDFMNAGTVQTLLDEAKAFNEDDCAVVVFSALKALSVLVRGISSSFCIAPRHS